ncbi:fido domain-containing protein [Schizothecium vesticola]|uniref:Fido domain-containing protein n=1 Tax=Schizothecium vesticola TaxID=314040 RepID=A0AA40F895_9PEZI|nr:fido domain-containing protein [Schizothecium vesticola]
MATSAKKIKHKRSSLSNIFGAIPSASSAGPNDSNIGPKDRTSPINITKSIREKMQKAIFPNATVRIRSRKIPACFTISMADGYDYNLLGDEFDPDDLYDEMLKYNQVLAESLQSGNLLDNTSNIVDEFMLDVLSKMIFGSNYIEQAGAGLDITLKLCHAIFYGETVPDEITERDPEYQALKEDLVRQGLPAGTPAVIRSRREIVQHARAASYILNETYLKENDLTEDIILETHRILTHKVDTEDGYPWAQYSGVYRTVPVRAGLHTFPAPGSVPAGMQQLIASLNKDLQDAASQGEIDPVGLAAKYSHKFVGLHPFVDGNGRTCRLILNTLLIKYGALPACIGQDSATREKYLEIAATASLQEASAEGDWDDDEEGAPKHHKGLATFTLKFVTEELRALARKLKGKGAKAD